MIDEEQRRIIISAIAIFHDEGPQKCAEVVLHCLDSWDKTDKPLHAGAWLDEQHYALENKNAVLEGKLHSATYQNAVLTGKVQDLERALDRVVSAVKVFVKNPDTGMDRTTLTYTYTEVARRMFVGYVEDVARTTKL